MKKTESSENVNVQMGKVKISKEEYKDLIFLDDIPWVGLPHNVRAAHLLHPAHMGGNGSPLCDTTSFDEQVIIIYINNINLYNICIL